MLKKLLDLIRSFLGLFYPSLKKTPEELLEEEREGLRAQLATFNQGLAAHARVSARLISKVRKLKQQETALRDRIKKEMGRGQKERAGLGALELQEMAGQRASLRKQLEEAEQTYRSLIQARDNAVRVVKTRIERIQNNLDVLKVQQATADFKELAVDTVSGAGDSTLASLQEMVEDERCRAVGRAKVADYSLEISDPGMSRLGKRELADQALADFAAEEGLSLDSGPPKGRPRERE